MTYQSNGEAVCRGLATPGLVLIIIKKKIKKKIITKNWWLESHCIRLIKTKVLELGLLYKQNTSIIYFIKIYIYIYIYNYNISGSCSEIPCIPVY